MDPVLVTWSWVSATKCGLLAKIWGVQKNKHGHNFQNIGSKMNQWLLIGYEPTLNRLGSDILKIATVLVFLDTTNMHFFRNEGQLRRPLTWPLTPSTPLYHTYSAPSRHEDSPVASKICHSHRKWVNRDWVIRFWAIFGHFWGGEPNLHSKISEFNFLSVSFDFFCMKSHCKP